MHNKISNAWACVTLANSDTNEGKSSTKRSAFVNLNSLCDFSLQVPKSPRYKKKRNS